MNKMGQFKREKIIIPDNDIDAIIFRNFSGRPDAFNKNGAVPNFTLVLPLDVASYLSDKGLNVRGRKNKDGDTYYTLKVLVRFDNYPPEVYKICGKRKVLLDADTIGTLDRADIEHVDVSINPSRYSGPAGEGITAYLSVGHFTIADDPFGGKYDFDEEEDDELPFAGE